MASAARDAFDNVAMAAFREIAPATGLADRGVSGTSPGGVGLIQPIPHREAHETPLSRLSQTRAHRMNPRLSSFTKTRCAARSGRMSAVSIAMSGVSGAS